MTKWKPILLVLATSLFIAGNAYLLFGEKSTIQPSFYVTNYERMIPRDYVDEMAKQALVTPAEVTTISVGQEEAVQQWLVSEGASVKVGDELAILQQDQGERQRVIWQAEEEALLEQRIAIEQTIDQLHQAREQSTNEGTTATQKKADDSEVHVRVDLSDESAFAQAVAESTRALAEVDRQLTVVRMQLAQPAHRTALISPVDGVVANVQQNSQHPSIEIYSHEKVFSTFVGVDEWQKLQIDQPVLIGHATLDQPVQGVVSNLSDVPTNQQDQWRQAYEQAVSPTTQHALDFYKVQLSISNEEVVLPYGALVQAAIRVQEVTDGFSVKAQWLHWQDNQQASIWSINEKGKLVAIPVEPSFSLYDRVVVEGLKLGDIVVYLPNTPKTTTGTVPIYLSMPTEWPSKKAWQSFGWRNYVKYFLLFRQ